MTKHAPLLAKSFNVLNSFLLSVAVLIMLEPSVFLSYFPEGFIASFWSRLLLLAFIPISACLYAGCMGTLIEMASGQEMILKMNNFKDNIKKFWISCFLAIISPGVLGFFIYVFISKELLSVKAVAVYFDILILYILAYWMISGKYLRKHVRRRGKVNIKFREAIVLAVLYGIRLVLFYMPDFVTIANIEVSRITLLFSKYIYLLTFLYLSNIVLNNYPQVKENFGNRKEVFLINPLGGTLFRGLVFAAFHDYPPVFIVLKALTPKYYKIREFNQVIWQNRYFKDNVLVAITCCSFTSPDAYKIAKGFKERGAKVIMGGAHVSCFPDEALECCDSVVIGEVEGLWQQVIKDYENNVLKQKYYGTALDNPYTPIHQELLKSTPKMIKDFLETSRGCRNKCFFCSVPFLCGGKVRKRPVNEIVELLKIIKHKYKTVSFMDNNIYNDPSYTKELLTAIKPLKFKWQGYATIDIAKNDEVLRLAKESGCQILVIGYEMAGDSVEKKQGGKFVMADKYMELTRKIKKTGIQIKANFTIGFESDDIKYLFRLWKFCFLLNPYYTAVGVMTPLPGTPFYDEMIKQNRITNLNWRQYTALDLVFRHRHLNHVVFSQPVFGIINLFFFFTTSKLGYYIIMFFVAIILLASWFNL